jgi:hypothetical protein
MGAATLTVPEFIRRWEHVPQTERAKAQPHFLDICHLLGQPTPIEADPRGEWYAFEKRVARIDGRKGYADVWMRDHFAWEYKGHHRDLKAAYQQIQTYREPLDNPPLLIVCDTINFQIHTNFTKSTKAVHEFSIHDLTDPGKNDLLRRVFTDPEWFDPRRTRAEVTKEAATRFASIADGLRDRGIPTERAAHFLTQLLFCLYAEDVRLLPRDTFTRVVERASKRRDRFVPLVRELFETMRTGGEFLLDDIPWFNGGLFAEIEPIELYPEELARLREVAALDWGNIDTTIIGTLFERSLDPDKRGQLGMHYTGRDDILKIVDPVVMAPLRREWHERRADAEKLRVAAEEATTPRLRRNRQIDLERQLLGFKERLAEVTILDPACGSGNFLSVALGALLDLEKEISQYAAWAGISAMFPEVGPRQMYGLEVNPYAHELAQVGVWITYLQWMNANGFQPKQDPVLQPLDTIRLQDAVLDLSDPTQPKEAAWPTAEYIVGNPPFLGGKRLRSGLGDAYVETMYRVYAGRVPHEADLVSYWHEKARDLIATGHAKRAGLIATQSIRAGANRRILERAKESGDLFMAWSDEPWVLDGAAVRISIVGYDDGSEQDRVLNGQAVEAINSDLTGALDITTACQLQENADIAFMGDTKGGPFDIPDDLARRWLTLPHNPNGRPNSDVVRPWVNGLDVTRRPRNMWIIDFGTDMAEADAALYESPFEYARQNVEPARKQSKTTIREWWRHERPRVDMREAVRGLSRYIATPRVATHRLFVWLRGNTLADSRLFVFARDDDYFFGVLHSRAHELWSLRTASWHGVGNDPTYNTGTCFETYPFAWPPGKEPTTDPRVQAIAFAARRLVELRDNWLNALAANDPDLKKRTLTNLYNQRPTWLDNAHTALDRAVLDAYGWPHDLNDDELLARLLALNLDRARKQIVSVVPDDAPAPSKPPLGAPQPTLPGTALTAMSAPQPEAAPDVSNVTALPRRRGRQESAAGSAD